MNRKISIVYKVVDAENAIMKDWLSIDEERRFLHCAQFSSMKSIVEQGE